jgi:hypothetical protein
MRLFDIVPMGFDRVLRQAVAEDGDLSREPEGVLAPS